MSLDDYIRRLTTAITQELQAPLEDSLRVLLGEVMEKAQHDREEAVRTLEAELATLRADYQAADARAESERGSLLEQHAAALVSLRQEVTAEVGQSVLAEANEAARLEREASEAALREDLERGHAAKLQEAEAALRKQHEAELAKVRDEVTAEVGQAVLVEANEAAQREREAAEAALREELAREHGVKMQEAEAALRDQHQAELARLREEVAAEVGQRVLSEAREAAESERQASEQALRAQLAADREAGEHALRTQFAAEREVAEQALRRALSQDFDERLEEARAQEAGARPAVPAGRLLDAFRRLDRAPSLTDALVGLLEHAAAVNGRTAVFLVTGERVRGWRELGFDAPAFGDIDLPLHQAGAIGLAVQTADVVSTGEYRAGESSLPEWLQPRDGNVGVSIPVVVGGRVVAVLYADDPGGHAGALEILARHAGRCLEVLTLVRVSAAPGGAVQAPHADEDVRRSEAAGPVSDSMQQEESARRYARLLISELKLYNEAAVEEGRRHRDLLARLGPEVERARRLYEEKIPAVVRERARWFEEELVRTLAGGDASMLGQVT